MSRSASSQRIPRVLRRVCGSLALVVWSSCTPAHTTCQSDHERLVTLESRLLDARDCEERGSLLFELANHHWQQSKDHFFESQDISRSQAHRRLFTQEMNADQTRMFAALQKIRRSCSGYSKIGDVLYFGGMRYLELGDETVALQWLGEASRVPGNPVYGRSPEALVQFVAATKSR